jgi:Colicin V production protein
VTFFPSIYAAVIDRRYIFGFRNLASWQEICFVSPAMDAQVNNLFGKASVTYFDLIVVICLVVGMIRGRKMGMSQVVLPALKWVTIAVLAGFGHRLASLFLRQSVPGAFDLLWANRLGYILIALGVIIVFAGLKRMFGEKLTGSDFFGSAEYYLGMFAGIIWSASMILVLLALMNSRVYTKAENDAYEAAQIKQMDNSFIPSYGQIQYKMLTTSFTGQIVKQNLSPILIMSVIPGPTKKSETPGQKSSDTINQVLGANR